MDRLYVYHRAVLIGSRLGGQRFIHGAGSILKSLFVEKMLSIHFIGQIVQFNVIIDFCGIIWVVNCDS